jgi:glycosyltransferase involved in cell wall biosynthesis
MNYCFIIATFNSSKYIEEAIYSLTSQINAEDKIIVVNDKSTDNTQTIIESLKNKQITLINLPNNIGAAGARNEGLKLAKSDYVVFLDSDDLWQKDIYPLINNTLMSRPDIDILSGLVENFFSSEIKDQLKKQYKLPPISRGNFSASLVIKRSFLNKIGGFNPAFRERGEWIDFSSRLLAQHPKIIELDNIFYKRRIHETNNSHQFKDLKSYIPALRETILRRRLKN